MQRILSKYFIGVGVILLLFLPITILAQQEQQLQKQQQAQKEQQNLYEQQDTVSSSYYLEGVVVRAKPEVYKKKADAPLSKITIGVAQIEKSAGGNRDISKIITVVPGVATPPPNGSRNDFLVRGGGPGENKFYIDGFEVPSINHFSTQGAGGGPVGIVNADLIRKVDFYTGMFPIARSNALSSVMDITLKDGSPVKNTLKLSVGASEVAASADGNISFKKVNGIPDPKLFYAVSLRHSYLQFLFQALKLPLLPTFTDAQVKLRYRLNYNNEFSFLFLGGLDRMKLNESGVEDASGEYIIGYLPVIEQDVYTVGLSYKHYYSGENSNNNTLALYLSHSYLNSRSIKYFNNDESSLDNLILRSKAIESQTQLRAENKIRYSNNITLLHGAGVSLPNYSDNRYQKLFIGNSQQLLDYSSKMNLFSWSLFANVQWWNSRKSLSLSGALRAEATNYNSSMSNPLNQISPRVALSYEFVKGWKLNFGAGRYFQLPAYTAMGYNYLENKPNLKYLSLYQASIGLEYSPSSNVQLQLEPFIKSYSNALYSPVDSIPLTQGGTDYGTYGNELAVSGLSTLAYGVELSARWNIADKFNFIGSYTLFNSKYKGSENLHPIINGARYGRSAWDNRHLLSLSAGYNFGKNYALGIKYRLSGGTPYTPYDLELSASVPAWDAKGQPYYNYALYNSETLPMFQQLDIRFDKSFYFKNWALELYLDVQNILNAQYVYPHIVVSSGVIENTSAPIEEQRYLLNNLSRIDGTVLPTIGIIISL